MPDTFVLDCSVAAKWVLPEPDRGPALGWFERHASGEVLLIAPDILLAEFASLVAKRNRRKQISAEQAREAFSLMVKFAPRLFDMRPRLFAALEMSLQCQLSLMGLRVSRACPGTRLSGSHRRPPAFPGRGGTASLCSPGAIRDPRRSCPCTRNRSAGQRLRGRKRPEGRFEAYSRVASLVGRPTASLAAGVQGSNPCHGA